MQPRIVVRTVLPAAVLLVFQSCFLFYKTAAVTGDGGVMTATGTASFSAVNPVPGTLVSLDYVKLFAFHQGYAGLLSIALTAPCGTTITLLAERGMGYSEIIYFYDDEALIFVDSGDRDGTQFPQMFPSSAEVDPRYFYNSVDSFAPLEGTQADGTWTITITNCSLAEPICEFLSFEIGIVYR